MFENVVQDIKAAQEAAQRGEVLYLDLSPFFPQLSEKFPGPIKGEYMLITANSGIGKSKFVRHLTKCFIALAEANPSIKLKIFLNSLEESQQKVAASYIQSYLQREHNIYVTYRQLFYPSVDGYLDARILSSIEKGQKYYDKLNSYIQFEHIMNPFGLYKAVRKYLAAHGRFYHVERDIDGKEVSRREIKDYKQGWNAYATNDPNHYIIVISDNLNAYQAEGNKSRYETVTDFSQRLCRNILCLKCNCIVINVQQQASDKERIDANYSRARLEKKLEPSLDGLGDFKITQRHCTTSIGLFDPVRYGIIKHAGYDLPILGRNYRSLHLLKNREEEASYVYPMITNLAVDHFEELPRGPTPEQLKKVLEKWAVK